MKICIFVTGGFPYGIGETFIESEISFLENAFDKVIILPIGAGKKELRPNIHLNNSVVLPVPFGRQNFLVKAISLACGFLFARPEARKEIRSLDSIKKKLTMRAFEGLGYIRFRKTRRRLDMEISRDEISSCVVYSYWLHLPAVIGSYIYFYLKEKIPNIKFVSRAHRYDLYAERNALNFLIHREFLLKAAAGVYPCSKNGERYLQQRYPEYAGKIHVAYLGTRDMGLGPWDDGQGFVIASCSNVIPVKRVGLILDVFCKLLSSGASARWVHFGDGSELQRIMATARDAGMEEKIEFRGRIPNSEVLDYYKENPIGLFINLSESEGLPVSIMEAMSFGIPVIATDVGGSSEIVDDSVGRLVAADESAESIAQKAMEIMALEESEYRKLRERSRAKWESSFNCEKNYAEWCNVLLS